MVDLYDYMIDDGRYYTSRSVGLLVIYGCMSTCMLSMFVICCMSTCYVRVETTTL